MACLTIGIGDRKQAVANPKPILEAEAKSTPQPIPISLPIAARVLLKDGNSRSGKVIDINSQHITIKKGESRGREAIANVAQIKFNGNIWWPTSTKPIVIRGNEVEMKGKPRRFQLRMDGFEWEDAEKGIAVIKPEAVVGVDDRKGLPRSMRNISKSRYIVSSIEFEPEQQILIITATSQSRKE